MGTLTVVHLCPTSISRSPSLSEPSHKNGEIPLTRCFLSPSPIEQYNFMTGQLPRRPPSGHDFQEISLFTAKSSDPSSLEFPTDVNEAVRLLPTTSMHPRRLRAEQVPHKQTNEKNTGLPRPFSIVQSSLLFSKTSNKCQPRRSCVTKHHFVSCINQTNKQKTTNQTENNPTKTSTNTFQPNLCKSLPRIKGKFFPSTPLPRGTLENCRFTVNEKVTYVYEPNPSSSSSSSVHYTSTHT